jgi:hypothetical protein
MGNDTIIHYKLEKAESVASPLFKEMTTFPYLQTSFTENVNASTPIFPPNTKYLYRISAANNVGYSPLSTSLEIVTDTFP